MNAPKYAYYIEYRIPELKTTKLPHQFIVFKQPITKYAPIYMLYVLLDTLTYAQLTDIINKQRYIDTYLDIYTIKDVHECKTWETKQTNFKKERLIVNLPLRVIKTTLLDTFQYDNVDFNFVSLIATNPKIQQLDSDYSFAKVFNDTSPKQLVDTYTGSLTSDYSIDSFIKIAANNYTYKRIGIKQDISLLEFPFYLQMHYKISNNTPIIFLDTFASFELFQTYEMFKLFDLDKFNEFPKIDASQKFDSFSIIKNENITHSKLQRYLSSSPSKLVLIDPEGNAQITQVEQKRQSFASKFNQQSNTFQTQSKTTQNNLIINLHVVDTYDNTILRYNNLISLYNKIQSVSRVMFNNVFYPVYDIGVTYRFSQNEQFKKIFLNLCYRFKLTGSLYYTCDIIGDMLTFK